MKKFLITLALTLLGSAPVAAATVINIVGDNWCPYNCPADAADKGYLVDVIKAALGEKYEVRYVTEPWTRAVKLVESGERHLLLATTPSTTPGLKLSEAIGIDRTCFFVRKESKWRYAKVKDLDMVTLGAIPEYNYDGDGPIDQMIARYRKEKSPLLELAYGNNAVESNFRKLRAGRAEVVIENENVARYTLRSLGIATEILPAGCVSHYQGTVHIGVSPKLAGGSELLRQINRGVGKMRADGRLKTELERYGIADWQPLIK